MANENLLKRFATEASMTKILQQFELWESDCDGSLYARLEPKMKKMIDAGFPKSVFYHYFLNMNLHRTACKIAIEFKLTDEEKMSYDKSEKFTGKVSIKDMVNNYVEE